jgi:dTDP-4-amino-4,6-dideoxygalactose transaminase
MIPVLKPSYTEKIKKDLCDVLDSGWTGFGAKTIEFERKFADYVGSKYAVATNSGTSALDLCLKAYGIKGGELITTPMTFVSDVIVGEWNDMDCTFADIEEDSLCLDPKSIYRSKNTIAIIAVDSHGRLANIDEIRKRVTVKTKDDLYCPLIIEDAAHAMFTPGAGKKADITIWSFQAVKSMPIFDGGMITTNDEKIYQKLRTLTWLGVEKSTYERAEGKRYSWDYDITQSDGIKAYMTDVQSIIGLGQLERVGELCAKRRAVQSVYNEAFRQIKEIRLPMYSHTCQYYTMQCERRDELSDFLASKGISTSVHFKPLSEMTYWKKAVKRPLPITDRVWKKLLTLPVFHDITWEQVEYIISCVKEFYK